MACIWNLALRTLHKLSFHSIKQRLQTWFALFTILNGMENYCLQPPQPEILAGINALQCTFPSNKMVFGWKYKITEQQTILEAYCFHPFHPCCVIYLFNSQKDAFCIALLSLCSPVHVCFFAFPTYSFLFWFYFLVAPLFVAHIHFLNRLFVCFLYALHHY